jgi:hypothetical protein
MIWEINPIPFTLVSHGHVPFSIYLRTWMVVNQWMECLINSLSLYLSLAQLDEIRKMSISAVLCMTTGLKQVPAMGFRTIAPG